MWHGSELSRYERCNECSGPVARVQHAHLCRSVPTETYSKRHILRILTLHQTTEKRMSNHSRSYLPSRRCSCENICEHKDGKRRGYPLDDVPEQLRDSPGHQHLAIVISYMP